MENIIMLYCALMGLLLLAMFGLLLLGNDKTAPNKESLSATDKGLAACASLLLLLLAHLNWLVLPQAKQEALLPGFAFVGALLLLLVFGAYAWLKNKGKAAGRIVNWQRADGKALQWRVHLNNLQENAPALANPDDKLAG